MIPQSLYIDLDNVLADFNDGIRNHPLAKDKTYKGQPHLLPNIYLELKPVYKAKEAIQILNQSKKLDCFIKALHHGIIMKHGCTRESGLKNISEIRFVKN